ncbi:unnamed protein product [Rotaria sordida]|uniref:Uncharacterized protein n=1 Tax=Rotaria sordida TaxID=392033 RepID=A0A814FBZ1_9BILA|nr:unnamed protein product [Rotaria sordida]CAF0947210.1 unnamed protein product [Rotaria sordida]CAF0951129.1 unnamed protein product [Rotaria sordida]CAF0981201.1 unnamed protein product [Rotaria sordida]CAF3777555.1 unnamed protein product [Rotaria sordida]
MSTIRSSQPTMVKSRPRSTSQPTVSSRKMSKSLNLPSSLTSDIFRILHNIVLVFCRRIIFAPPTLKILVYFCLIIIGPFLKDFHFIPNTSLSSKANNFNKYITKIGWMWSIFLLIPFVYLTSLIYTRGHYGLIIRHLIRLLIATTIWYIIMFLFIRIEALTGMCKPNDMRRIARRICHTSRYQWQEGRTFFLLYALLVINEEVKLYGENWKKIEDANKISIGNTNTSLSLNQNRMKMFSIPIGILYIALAILSILWEFLLLSTVLYIYNILHKLIAASFAVFFWFITYRIWYRQNNRSKIAPCAPGDGFITF